MTGGLAKEWLARLEDIPAVDNHCHSVRNQPLPDVLAFRQHFSESSQRSMHEKHVPSQLYFRWALHELGQLLGCAADEGAVFAIRNTHRPAELTRLLLQASGLKELYIDTGLSRSGVYSLAEMAEAAGMDCFEVLRLETLEEDLVAEHRGFGEFLEAFDGALQRASAAGLVGLKSIAAYRCGLDFGRPERAQAEAAFQSARREHEQRGGVRLVDADLIGYCLWHVLDFARERRLPIQFHTGLGDADEDLLRANCLLLRPLLEDPVGAEVPIVILHSYPYEREAAHLAHLYPNVYVDLGGGIPWVAGAAAHMIEATLGQCPASKLLFSTDAGRIPEIYYLGALAWRRGLAEVLARWEDAGVLDEASGLEISHQVLAENARSLYQPQRRGAQPAQARA
jgi:predicted TIM-barrel fold metal-dependent hydrolase